MKNGKELGAVIERLLTSFEKVLYEGDAQFLENMKKRNVPAGGLENPPGMWYDTPRILLGKEGWPC